MTQFLSQSQTLMSAPVQQTYSLLDHPARISEEDLLKSCKLRFGRASGPGGQHRNKVETAVRLEHLPTGVEAAATETRSQTSNRKKALSRLRFRLALSVPVKLRRDESPSELWKKRCLDRKIVCNPEHAEAPALLTELWAFLSCENFDLSATAARLDCTSSQIVKFVGLFPTARERIQQERQLRNLPPLKFRT